MPILLFNKELRNASYTALSETHESKRTIRRIGPAMFDGDATLSAGEPRVAGQLARAHARCASVHDVKGAGTIIHSDRWPSDVLGRGCPEREGPAGARMAHEPTRPDIERDRAQCGGEQAGLELARERLNHHPRGFTVERRGRGLEQEAGHEQGGGEGVGIYFQASGFGYRAFDLFGTTKH